MNFQELKNKIIAWFWKMGYKLGNAVGLLGKELVDEAFSAGFKDTAFQAIDMETLLNNLEDTYENEFASMADFTNVSTTDLGSLEFKDVFVDLFEGHFQSAHSVFTSNNWSAEYGSWDSSVSDGTDPFSADTQQDGSSGTHIRYTDALGTEEVVVEVTRNVDNSVASATVIVGK